MDAGPAEEDGFARIAALLARLLAVPAAQVALAGDDDHALPDRVTLRETPLVVEDAGRAQALPAGAGAFVGWPLRLDGRVVGSLYALDTAPRDWAPGDLALVADLAGLAERLIALHDGARVERARRVAVGTPRRGRRAQRTPAARAAAAQ